MVVVDFLPARRDMREGLVVVWRVRAILEGLVRSVVWFREFLVLVWKC